MEKKDVVLYYYEKGCYSVTTIKPTQVDPPTAENTKEIANWDSDDFLCKNYILNALSDYLYDYYSSFKTAKDVWDALQKKYDTEEAGSKKYVVGRYMKFQMVEEKSVVSQSHELQKITHEILSEGMQIDDQFQVAVLIDKLPTSWNDVKKELYHKTKEFLMESPITKIRVEEEARKQDSKEDVFVVSKDNNETPAHLKPKKKFMKPSHN